MHLIGKGGLNRFEVGCRKCKDLHPIKFIWTQRISQVVSSSVASELIKSFDTAIRTPPYDWFGLSLRYTVYPQSGLKISIELMFEFSQVSVPMICQAWWIGVNNMF